jgi:hypothetical protein
MPIKKTCVVCGESFFVPPSRDLTAKTCSNECAVSVRAKSRSRGAVFNCANCGKETPSIPSQVKRRRFCSVECMFADKQYKEEQSERTFGENNPMWRGGETGTSDGYIYKKASGHPFSNNGYVLKHRLVAEEMLRNETPESEFLIELGEHKYLSPAAIVHHRNGIREDNSKRNLCIMSSSDHTRLHNKTRKEVGRNCPIEIA